MPLTDIAIRSAKPTDKQFKLFDEGGLFLIITPSGGRWWRFKYRYEGKEKLLSMGTYPEVSLKDARDKRDSARKQVAAGIDPSSHRKAVKLTAETNAANSFEVVAREWFSKLLPSWTEGHAEKILSRLERLIFPHIGARPIASITAQELLAVLRRIEAKGTVETAHRALQNCGQVFRYGIATGRAERDIGADLRGALASVKVKHHPSITEPKAIGALMRAIRDYDGEPITQAALRLAPLVFVRAGELRKAEWSEINFDESEWRIPAERMKMRVVHVVPLSEQAIGVLKEIHLLTGRGKYIFTGARTNGRPMSENTINAALRRLGYTKEEMTGHGFRSMASTVLNEQGWNRDAIERQLAHAERNDIRAAYNYAEHLKERKRMMQHWADYLDELADSNVMKFAA